jgi:hypothetical protein
MESTFPKGKSTDYQLEIDILRSRWTANGFRFTEASLQRVARANEESRIASLKKQAQAESDGDEDEEPEPQPQARSSTGRSAQSRTDTSHSTAADWDFDVSEINDAWKQYDEEKQQQQRPPEDPEPNVELEVEPDEPEADPGQEPEPEPAPVEAAEPEPAAQPPPTAAEPPPDPADHVRRSISEGVKAAKAEKKRCEEAGIPRSRNTKGHAVKKTFKGIFMSAAILAEPNLLPIDKMILAIVDSFATGREKKSGRFTGPCTAANEGIAMYLGESNRYVGNRLAMLQAAGRIIILGQRGIYSMRAVTPELSKDPEITEMFIAKHGKSE